MWVGEVKVDEIQITNSFSWKFLVNCWRIFCFSRCASPELCSSHSFKHLGQAQTVPALVCRFEQLDSNNLEEREQVKLGVSVKAPTQQGATVCLEAILFSTFPCHLMWSLGSKVLLGSCITYWALKSSLDAIPKEIQVKPDIVMFPTTELEIVNINGQLPICLIVWGLQHVGRFLIFMRTSGCGFGGRFWEPPWFFKKSHFENCPGFQKFLKNKVRRFPGSVVLTKFWAVGFQGRFSEVGSHKSWFAKIKNPDL
jgi:hypothetical protein